MIYLARGHQVGKWAATACRQDRLVYEFNLEERIPPDHLLRRIDAALDPSWLRADLAPFYSHTGCPGTLNVPIWAGSGVSWFSSTQVRPWVQAGVRGRRGVWLLSRGKPTFEPNVSF